MVERKIKIKGYSVPQGEGEPDRLARRGEVIEISEEEAKRGDALGYFFEEGVEDDDTDSDSTGTEQGGWTVLEASDDELDVWLAGDEDSAPTVEDVISAAGEDAEAAERLLASETRVAAQKDRDVRKTLEAKLSEIAGASN